MAKAMKFRVRGTTDDVTTCDCCGRQNLKATVVMEVLDADGNGTGQMYYLGRDCAAKASGWTQREVMRRAREADDEAERQRRWEADQRERAECDRWFGWLREQTGCTEVMDAILALGGFAAARAQYQAWLSQQA